VLRDERQSICRKALHLKANQLTQWEMGFIHAVVFTSGGIHPDFYAKLQELTESIDAQ